MREHPELFNAPMVRRLPGVEKDPARWKTQTRRLLTPKNTSIDGGPWRRGWLFELDRATVDRGPSPAGNPGPYLKAPRIGADTVHRLYPRWQPGDRLWVRETWGLSRDAGGDWLRFAAGGAPTRINDGKGPRFSFVDDGKRTWRPSIHMPRWASRIALEVTSIRVERLQDISEEDAWAEGVEVLPLPDPYRDSFGLKTPGCAGYAQLWDSINGERAPWESNPWVWVVEFATVTAKAVANAD